MRENALLDHMARLGLAKSTQNTRLSSLKRVEKFENIDLDEEFDRDQMQSLIARFDYTADDTRSGRPNPSNIEIPPENLSRDLSAHRYHLNAYRQFRMSSDEGEDIDSSDLAVSDDRRINDAIDQTFGLERDLQTALRSDIGQLEPGLRVADDGLELKVESGFIDILALDKEGVWTVIELKAGTARPDAIAQILGYMGCIASEKGGQVRGILVAADHSSRVVFAAGAVPNLSLKKYRYRFDFE